jgi:hypothetical protein
MAAPRPYYTLETRAHRDGYFMPDVDGKTMLGDQVWADIGAPEVLKTGFDTDDVWRRWKNAVWVCCFSCLFLSIFFPYSVDCCILFIFLWEFAQISYFLFLSTVILVKRKKII